MTEKPQQSTSFFEVLAAWKAAYALLDTSLQKEVWHWFVISLFGRTIQALGVVSIMPFVALISAPDLINDDGVLAWVYEASGANDYQQFLLWVGLATIAVYLFTAAFTCFEVWFGARLSNHIGYEFSTRLFGIYINQDYRFFLVKNRSEAFNLVTEEVEETLVGLVVTGIEIVSNIFMAVLITVILMIASFWTAVLSAVCLMTVYYFISRFFTLEIERIGSRLYSLGVESVATVQEMLGGIREIKACEAEEKFSDKFKDVSYEKAELSKRFALMEFIPRQLLEVVTFVGIVVFALVSMMAHASPQDVLPTIALYGIAAYRLIPTVREIYEDIETVAYSKHAIQRLLKEFQYESQAINDSNTKLQLMPTDALIEVSHISFKYPSETQNTLEDLSFSVKQNTITALTGPSGVGKSTVIDIFAGFLIPDEGLVKVEGNELTQALTASWRKKVSYISQSVYLFDGTIADNISMLAEVGKVDQDLLDRVCKVANFDVYVSQQKQGYDTRIGVGEKSLSGGQLKRLGLARALYREPHLLILDETLNELDNDTQSAILDSLSAIEGLSLLIVSHDPRVLSYCKHTITLSYPNNLRMIEAS